MNLMSMGNNNSSNRSRADKGSSNRKSGGGGGGGGFFRLLSRKSRKSKTTEIPGPPLAQTQTQQQNQQTGKRSIEETYPPNLQGLKTRDGDGDSISTRNGSQVAYTQQMSVPVAAELAMRQARFSTVSRSSTEEALADMRTSTQEIAPLSNYMELRRKNSTPGTTSKKKQPKLSAAQIDMIRECWETSKHSEFGTRIYSRFFQKRPDIREVYADIEEARPGFSWKQESRDFNDFLHELIEKIDDHEVITEMSHDWGCRHVHLRVYGFKPSFWVPFAEIMTTECLYLDAGVHPVADMIGAWATLITVMLANMRDGFYNHLRHIRRQSKKRQVSAQILGVDGQRFSNDSESDQQYGGTPTNGDPPPGILRHTDSQASLAVGSGQLMGQLIYSAMEETRQRGGQIDVLRE